LTNSRLKGIYPSFGLRELPWYPYNWGLDYILTYEVFLKEGESVSKYVLVYSSGERGILADMKKYRVYARFYGFMSKGMFNTGQAALDATFAIMANVGAPHIDYILDIRGSEPFPEEVFALWKEKAFEVLTKYPQLHTLAVFGDETPFWKQISQWRELFEQFGNRILGTFKIPEEAETFLDKLRGYPAE
jgi:hypothetical protein